ncbi:MAG: hypothetical protein ACKV2T_13505 [Kofleriaceae bacterium]
MKELLSAPIATEKRATCSDCAMLADKGESPAFDPRVKCCTFYPELPNYTVGAIISDRTSYGQVEVSKRFRSGVGLTPLGMARPVIQAVLMQKSAKGDAFGRALSLKCPFQTPDLRCGIWAYREATCFYYHCKFDRGKKGADLWQLLRTMFIEIEQQLALWCVVELDPGVPALEALEKPIQALGHHELDGTVDKEAVKALWGTWLGREAEFYVECWNKVSVLSWTDVLAICGPTTRVHARRLAAAFAAHESTDIPETLSLSNFRAAQVGRRVRLRTFSTTDSITLDADVFGALTEFDGRPTPEVVAALGARGITLDEDELRRLVDFEVLIPTTRLTKGPPA